MAKILINNHIIEYTLKRSRKARRLRISVKNDGSVTATLPFFSSEKTLERFMQEKAGWILGKIIAARNKKSSGIFPGGTRREYLENKIKAERFIKMRIKELNKHYDFKFTNISIKNQATRWGSCSKKGSLNFNYKLVLLPASLADYIIVHELCHLKEFNHGRNFWKLVSLAVPDYQARRKELKNGKLLKIS